MSLPDSLTDLTPADCPLMPEALVHSHNALVGALRAVRANVPRLVPAVDQLAADLRRVRARMTRDRYHVGFLGRTQLGKSTTFNNILGVVDDPVRRPSEQGDGSSTTSVITRLRSVPAGPDTIELHYTLEERFRYKRDQMCRAIDLDPSLPDRAILGRLPELEQKVKRGEKDAKTEDPRYLRRLLLSGGEYGRRLGSAPEQGEYPLRFEYTTHRASDDAASPYLLLEDVLIHFRTDAIHPDLEMIDLPGLGAHVTIDTVISRERLEELDGGLVFVNIKGRDDEVAENIFTGLRKNFAGDFQGRVWLIFTHCDGLGDDFLRGKGTSGENGFDGVARLAARHGIDPKQVFLVSNHLSRKVPRVNGKLEPTAAAAVLGFPAGAIPPGLDRHPALHPAYEALFEDGGIGQLRDLLRTELVEHVRKRARDWVAAGLARAAAGLVKELEFDRRRGAEDLLKDVKPCLVAAQEQLLALQGRNGYLDEPAARIREELRQQFADRFIPTPYNDSRSLDEIKERYPFDARALEIALELHFESSLPRVYASVGAAFHGLPEVPVHGQSSVQRAWEHVGEEDSEDPGAWVGEQYPAFVDRELFSAIRPCEADPFNGQLYRSLMEDKIQVSVQQAMHVLRWRLVERMEKLEQSLEAMTRVDPEAGAGRRRLNYDELISTLRKLCPST